MKKALQEYQGEISFPNYIKVILCLPPFQQIDFINAGKGLIFQLITLQGTNENIGKRISTYSSKKNDRTTHQRIAQTQTSRRGKRKIIEWTEDEDIKIFKLVKKHGCSWEIIAKHFPSKNESQVKNRFYSVLRRVATKKMNENRKPHRSSILLRKEELWEFIDDALKYGHNCFSKRGRKRKIESLKDMENTKVKCVDQQKYDKTVFHSLTQLKLPFEENSFTLPMPNKLFSNQETSGESDNFTPHFLFSIYSESSATSLESYNNFQANFNSSACDSINKSK